MDKPLVSIVMPVYNTAGYVGEAVESILTQTLTDLELVAVNDGSTDDSLAVLEKLSERDNRLRVFSQANSGQAAARNFGIEHVSGKYIYFMDSDDVLDSAALERLVAKCETEKLDMVAFDADVFGDDGTFSRDFYLRSDRVENRIYRGAELMNRFLDINGYRGSVCLLLVNRNYFNSLELRQPAMPRYEDDIFTTTLYISADRVGVVPCAFYHRRVRAGSIMTTSDDYPALKYYFVVADRLQELSRTVAGDGEKRRAVERYIRTMLTGVMHRVGRLKFADRFGIVMTAILHYTRYVRPVVAFKTLIVKHK